VSSLVLLVLWTRAQFVLYMAGLSPHKTKQKISSNIRRMLLTLHRIFILMILW